MIRKEIAMKRILLTVAALGVLACPVLAAGVPTNSHLQASYIDANLDHRTPVNIVQVDHYYHGGHSGGHHNGWYGPRVYYPPVWVNPQIVRPYPCPPPIYRPYYYTPPYAGFYYRSPGISIGVGF
jgi:hypothetical protein